MDLNSDTRRVALEALAAKRFDILVMGGGITGAGIAREAALRGYQTALVDKGDFASGTSSASSKLVHGGLRYLEQFDFRLVREALQERRILLDIAPHLVRPIRLLFPLYHHRAPHPLRLRAGLVLYDVLAGSRRLERHEVLSAAEAKERQPGLAGRDLRGAGVFSDCWTHDAALTIATLRDAGTAGASIANYAHAEPAGPGVAIITDEVNGDTFRAQTRLVISAVGPWTDPVVGGDHLMQSKGVHLAFPMSRLAVRHPMATISPKDGRLIFLLPWSPHAYVGTTDTPFHGDPDDVAAEPDDVAYLVEAARQAFPEAQLEPGDVSGAWAGIRPLLRSSRESSYRASREHSIWEPADRLLAISGGKLTTYRLMARRCVDAASRILSQDGLSYASPADTAGRQLPGGEPGWDAPLPGIEEDIAEYVTHRFGSESKRLSNGASRRLVPGLPHTEAEVRHLVRSELALRPEDVLLRRTLLAQRDLAAASRAASRVVELMAEELAWTASQAATELSRLQAGLEHRRRPLAG